MLAPVPPLPPVPSDLLAGGEDTLQVRDIEQLSEVGGVDSHPAVEFVDGELGDIAVHDVGEGNGDPAQIGLDGHFAHHVALDAGSSDVDVLVFPRRVPG